ncbi:phosphoserine phosphatase RsbU [bacterium BMS3Abin03]|nr:phosphoserine phosphatase RsbU [bacterium BMS3Abin03]
MSGNDRNIFELIQFKLFLVFASGLIIFKFFFISSDSILFKAVNDLLILLTVSFLFISLITYIRNKKSSSLSLIMNIGILNAFLFFLITFSGWIISLFFENAYDKINNPGLASTIISLICVSLIVVFSIYIFVALRHLFLLRQSGNLLIYFNTMLVFFVIAAVASNYFNSRGLLFISDAFFIVSILLMLINSLRISWIAFLTKKEKVTLLFLSVVISVLFIVNAGNTGNNSSISHILLSFSKPLNIFITLILIYGAIYFGMLFFTTLFHIPTAEAFDRKAEEVSSLQYFSKLITQVLDFDDLAETVTDITARLSGANAAWIIWNENDQFNSIANKNIGFVDSTLLNKYVIDKIDWQNLNETVFIKLNDFEDNAKLTQQIKTMAVSPLKAHGKVKGLMIAAHKDERKFTEEAKNAIDTFSDYASVAIENSTLLEESIEKERLEKELDVAREIQRKILPAENPNYEGLEISSVFIPAFEVGGDYYDFFEISDSKLGFVIADVSGKGISAALIMAEVKGIFESLSKTIERPREILIKANEILNKTLDERTFVSAVYGLINFDKMELIISRAGHCPALLLRGESAINVQPVGLGLGLSNTIYFKETLEETKIKLQENDTIVLYTDGITEAKNSKLEDFGARYFTEILIGNSDKTADEISNKVIKEVTVFSKDHSQYDDITLVIFKWKYKNNFDGEKAWQNSVHQL